MSEFTKEKLKKLPRNLRNTFSAYKSRHVKSGFSPDEAEKKAWENLSSKNLAHDTNEQSEGEGVANTKRQQMPTKLPTKTVGTVGASNKPAANNENISNISMTTITGSVANNDANNDANNIANTTPVGSDKNTDNVSDINETTDLQQNANTDRSLPTKRQQFVGGEESEFSESEYSEMAREKNMKKSAHEERAKNVRVRIQGEGETMRWEEKDLTEGPSHPVYSPRHSQYTRDLEKERLQGTERVHRESHWATPSHQTQNYPQRIPYSQGVVDHNPFTWADFWRIVFWATLVVFCLAFIIWGNARQMEGELPEVIFKSCFGEFLILGAGMVSIRTFKDQLLKVVTTLAGVLTSLFLTHATVSANYQERARLRLVAASNLEHAESVRNSIQKNLDIVPAERIRRAEELRQLLAEAQKEVKKAADALQRTETADKKSFYADLMVRLLAQLTIVMAASQLRRKVD